MSIRTYIAALVTSSFVAWQSACAPALAQAEDPPPPLAKNSAPSESSSTLLTARPGAPGLSDPYQGRTPYELWLALLAAVTGVIIIAITQHRVSGLECVRPKDISRPAVVITIVVAILFLMIAGFSNQQLAAAFGILGTLVGHALSRASAGPANDDPASKDAQKESAGEHATAGNVPETK